METVSKIEELINSEVERRIQDPSTRGFAAVVSKKYFELLEENENLKSLNKRLDISVYDLTEEVKRLKNRVDATSKQLSEEVRQVHEFGHRRNQELVSNLIPQIDALTAQLEKCKQENAAREEAEG
jgi:molecular chaperone GrpE (heat shock protein)